MRCPREIITGNNNRQSDQVFRNVDQGQVSFPIENSLPMFWRPVVSPLYLAFRTTGKRVSDYKTIMSNLASNSMILQRKSLK